jgi:hypothetical protein
MAGMHAVQKHILRSGPRAVALQSGCEKQTLSQGKRSECSLSEVLDGEIRLLLADQLAVLQPILNENLRKDPKRQVNGNGGWQQQLTNRGIDTIQHGLWRATLILFFVQK